MITWMEKAKDCFNQYSRGGGIFRLENLYIHIFMEYSNQQDLWIPCSDLIPACMIPMEGDKVPRFDFHKWTHTQGSRIMTSFLLLSFQKPNLVTPTGLSLFVLCKRWIGGLARERWDRIVGTIASTLSFGFRQKSTLSFFPYFLLILLLFWSSGYDFSFTLSGNTCLIIPSLNLSSPCLSSYFSSLVVLSWRLAMWWDHIS